MKFDSKILIEKAAAKDDARPVLNAVHYNKAARRLEASDGYVLCVLAVTDDEQDEDALIPLAAMIEARAQAKAKKYDDCELHTQGEIVMQRGGQTCRIIQGVFPDVQQIIPDSLWDKPAFLEVSGEFLKRCGEVLGAAGSVPGKGKIALRRRDVTNPLLVTSVDVPNAFMFLMPLHGKVLDDGGTVDAPLPEIPAKLRGKRKKVK